MTDRAESLRAIGQSICAEQCAFYGDPPCWKISDEWPERTCDANCLTLARLALEAAQPRDEALVRAALEAAARECADWQAFTKYAQEPIALEMAQAIRALDPADIIKEAGDGSA